LNRRNWFSIFSIAPSRAANALSASATATTHRGARPARAILSLAAAMIHHCNADGRDPIKELLTTRLFQ
jgi:hypothetical protein